MKTVATTSISRGMHGMRKAPAHDIHNCIEILNIAEGNRVAQCPNANSSQQSTILLQSYVKIRRCVSNIVAMSSISGTH